MSKFKLYLVRLITLLAFLFLLAWGPALFYLEVKLRVDPTTIASTATYLGIAWALAFMFGCGGLAKWNLAVKQRYHRQRRIADGLRS